MTTPKVRIAALSAMALAAASATPAQAFTVADYFSMAADSLSGAAGQALVNMNTQFAANADTLIEIIQEQYSDKIPARIDDPDIVIDMINVVETDLAMAVTTGGYLANADSLIKAADTVSSLLKVSAPVSSATSLFSNYGKFTDAAKSIGEALMRGDGAILEAMVTLYHGGKTLQDVAGLGNDAVAILAEVVDEASDSKRAQMINQLVGMSGVYAAATLSDMAASGDGDVARRLILQQKILAHVENALGGDTDRMRDIKVYTVTHDGGFLGFIGGGYDTSIARYKDVAVDEDEVLWAVYEEEAAQRQALANRQKEQDGANSGGRTAVPGEDTKQQALNETVKATIETSQSVVGKPKPTPSTPSTPTPSTPTPGPVPALLGKYSGYVAMSDGDYSSTVSVYGADSVDLSAAYKAPAKGRTQASYYYWDGGRVDIRSSELQLNHVAPRFDYLSWGVWQGQQVVDYPSFRKIFRVGDFIIGRQTTQDEFRTLSGKASYAGPLRGTYSTLTEAGSLGGTFQLDANFSTKTFNGMFDFRTASGSALARARMVGTEIYHGSSFNGDLAPVRSGDTGSGTFRGRFYGPRAQEVGGIFQYQGISQGVFVRGLYAGKRR